MPMTFSLIGQALAIREMQAYPDPQLIESS
jgi:hypothetical protein